MKKLINAAYWIKKIIQKPPKIHFIQQKRKPSVPRTSHTQINPQMQNLQLQTNIYLKHKEHSEIN
jgi:hypothetical protein